MNESEIFNQALAIEDEAARQEFLASACAGDEALRQRIEVLLRASQDSQLGLQQPIWSEIPGGVTQAAGPEDDAAGTGDRTERMSGSDDEEDDEAGQALEFLQPANRAGSLGRLAHYEVLEVLGQGGFGTVLKAFDDKLHRMVAIKVMARGLAATSPARKRFLREARAAAAIRHENVVNIYAVDEQPIPYLVMEYIDGQTLQAKLDGSGPIEPAEVIRIGRQIADGLAAAHRQGLMHRDIKPGNILLEAADERVKITDFGLARAVDDASLTQSGTITGTPLYMAPEQALGESIDQRADLFSLGSVLYVMCTGRPPFRAPSTLAVLRRVAEDAPRPIREVIPEVPAGLCLLIDRLHAKNPADRFDSAREVADQLRDFQVYPAAAFASYPAARQQPAMIDSELSSPARRSLHDKGTSKRSWLRLNSGQLWTGVGACLLALVLALVLTRNFRIKRAQSAQPLGTLTVELADPAMDATITGEGVTIQRERGQAIRNLPLIPGRYRLVVRQADQIIKDEEILMTPSLQEIRVNLPTSVTQVSSSTTPKPVALGPWGRLVDPLGKCQATREGDRLIFDLPENTLLDLNPGEKNNLNAPRALQAVEGDFVVQVKVQTAPLPKPEDSFTGDGKAYRWTGLIFWVDELEFLRFGNARDTSVDEGRPFTGSEFFRDKKTLNGNWFWADEGAMYFRALRRGTTLFLKNSFDGENWGDYQTVDLTGLPAKIYVGVAAVNTASRAFRPEFEDWSLRIIHPALP